jgi:hypothetical protein
MAATWYRVNVDGTTVKLPHKPSLEGMQEAVGGYVEHVALDGKTHLWLNEEGKLVGLEVNPKATAAWRCYFGATDVIVGNVLFEIWGETKRNRWLVTHLETESHA